MGEWGWGGGGSEEKRKEKQRERENVMNTTKCLQKSKTERDTGVFVLLLQLFRKYEITYEITSK